MGSHKLLCLLVFPWFWPRDVHEFEVLHGEFDARRQPVQAGFQRLAAGAISATSRYGSDRSGLKSINKSGLAMEMGAFRGCRSNWESGRYVWSM